MLGNGFHNNGSLRTSRARALLKGLCPRCRVGKIYQRRLTMFERCPVCDLKFEREQGYFLGAMGVGYVLGLSILAGLIAIWSYAVFPQWPAYKAIMPALVICLPLLPIIGRYARIIWINFDRLMDPADRSG